jgi:hypothetical protein
MFWKLKEPNSDPAINCRDLRCPAQMRKKKGMGASTEACANTPCAGEECCEEFAVEPHFAHVAKDLAPGDDWLSMSNVGGFRSNSQLKFTNPITGESEDAIVKSMYVNDEPYYDPRTYEDQQNGGEAPEDPAVKRSSLLAVESKDSIKANGGEVTKDGWERTAAILYLADPLKGTYPAGTSGILQEDHFGKDIKFDCNYLPPPDYFTGDVWSIRKIKDCCTRGELLPYTCDALSGVEPPPDEDEMQPSLNTTNEDKQNLCGAEGGWEPSDGPWAGKGATCQTWGWSRKWCWVTPDYNGPGHEFKKYSSLYPNKIYAMCGGLDEDTAPNGDAGPDSWQDLTDAEKEARSDAEAQIATEVAEVDTPNFDPISAGKAEVVSRAVQVQSSANVKVSAVEVPTLELSKAAEQAASKASSEGRSSDEVEAAARMAAETAKAQFAANAASKKSDGVYKALEDGNKAVKLKAATPRVSAVAPATQASSVHGTAEEDVRVQVTAAAKLAAAQAKRQGKSPAEIAAAAGKAAGEAAKEAKGECQSKAAYGGSSSSGSVGGGGSGSTDSTLLELPDEPDEPDESISSRHKRLIT